ncbi:molybdenum cofactor synthesis domain-containing protein [Treponema sp. JC4]|uniref:molybdopterin molybdotransferase MoeA n=1 Tax=Treponema sp. JC4 TaxID=1124982 RepID=UPI00025B0C49|nr:gephyrin-like molybdotransferase Glp [Treponema sp. JC4]EID85183.1 molybdenum cofactor synthesis domain-containing protein [Treponema sp. JC4]
MELEEAVSILKNALAPLTETELCPLTQAHGRIAASDLYAPINVPPFAKSAMDGYAVRAADVAGASGETPVELKVTGQLFAGDWQENAPVEGAVRVMTGSPIPEGFDAVVMQEDTDYGEKKVLIYSPVRAGQNYCALGEDIKKDSLVLKAGTKIGRAHIGLLASLGIAEIEVRRKVKVAIITTGCELLEAGKALAPGKIYSSIAPMLSSAVLLAGQTVIENHIVSDDEKAISSAIKNAANTADIIITTGGVSVGKKDLLPAVLDSLTAKKLFSHVKIQPGTPTLVSLLNKRLILSLSGNPYAALANFDIYFYHAIAVLTGCPELAPQTKDAVLKSPYEKINKMRRLVRARYQDGYVSLPSQNHASSVISNLTECNCYLDAPATRRLSLNDKVRIIMIPE